LEKTKFHLKKMTTSLEEVVHYSLEVEPGNIVSLNDYIGGELHIQFLNEIHCVFCGKITPKSYGGGSCYSCLQALPQNDMCQVKPELCHLDRGTCRDADWGRKHCCSPHKVYLARSSGVKVGITREEPTSTRWMDQGAVEGMVIAIVPDRKSSGMVETAIAQHIADKTDFRKMLRGDITDTDLQEVYEDIADHVPLAYQSFLVDDPKPIRIAYPLAENPEKIKTKSLDKTPEISGTLKGIKGQYLIFEDFVFNVRAHTGYSVEMHGKKGPGYQAPEPKVEPDEPMTLFDFM
jgi:hypothetical protein